MTGERVEVRKRRRYAAVEVDLWRCEFDLSVTGQELCRELLEEEARLVFAAGRKPGGITFTAGPTFVHISCVLADRADGLASRLLAIVERHREPIRRPWREAR